MTVDLGALQRDILTVVPMNTLVFDYGVLIDTVTEDPQMELKSGHEWSFQMLACSSFKQAALTCSPNAPRNYVKNLMPDDLQVYERSNAVDVAIVQRNVIPILMQ